MFVDNNHIAYVNSTQMFHVLFLCGPKKLVKSPKKKLKSRNNLKLRHLKFESHLKFEIKPVDFVLTSH